MSQQTLVVPFLYGPILPHRSHFVVGLWWATGPTLPWYWLNFTPNYGVMVSHWIFWFLLELTTVNWNPFQRWFSEVAPVDWCIDFISRNYGWHVKGRFVIFGCSLAPLDYNSTQIFLGKHTFMFFWKWWWGQISVNLTLSLSEANYNSEYNLLLLETLLPFNKHLNKRQHFQWRNTSYNDWCCNAKSQAI